MSEEENIIRALQHHEDVMGELGRGYNLLSNKISRIESPYPMYVSRNDEQMMQELQAKGVLKKEEEGAADNVGKTFQHFTQVTDKGDLVPGLESKGKERKPASIMENIETLSAANFIYQFTPVGYVFEFLSGAYSAIKDAKNVPKGIRESVKLDFEGLYNYLGVEGKIYEHYGYRWNPLTERYEKLPALVQPQRPQTEGRDSERGRSRGQRPRGNRRRAGEQRNRRQPDYITADSVTGLKIPIEGPIRVTTNYRRPRPD